MNETSILVVDDDQDHAEIVRRTLERHDAAFRVSSVPHGRGCLEALSSASYALVLLDYSLPQMNGLEVLARIREKNLDVPVVMVTAQGNERVAVDAMAAGAIDYVVKTTGYFATLPTVVGKVLKQHELAVENARLYAEAHTQRTRLAQIFDSTSDGIVLADSGGRVLAANRRAGELLGFDAVTVLGQPMQPLLRHAAGVVATDESLAALLGLFNSVDRGGHGDLVLRPLGRTLEWTGQRTTDAARLVVGVTVTFRDVTREREIERLKSDFVSFATHQLRTPLSGIKWMLELARKQGEDGGALGSYLRDAAEAAERLIGMVNDLLNITRLEGGALELSPQPTDFAELTREVLDDLKPLVADKDLVLLVHAADGLPAALVEPQLFRQVIVNLVSNAVKYTPAGGAISIVIDAVPGELRWRISDTGIGVPRAAQSRLFQKFFRADNVATVDTEGTGLGLYLVRLIVELSGGRVWCESEEGHGSTFAFALPQQGAWA